MAGKIKRSFGRRLVEFYASCRLTLLETAFFIGFIIELGRFMKWWLWR